MKKAFLTLSLCLAAALSFAQAPLTTSGPAVSIAPATYVASSTQFKAQSVQVTSTGNSYSIMYISDGLKGSAAITSSAVGVQNLFGFSKLSANILLVNPGANTGAPSYVGSVVQYKLYSIAQGSVSIGLGFKGLDITNLITKGSIEGMNFNAPRQVIGTISATFKF